LGGRHATQHVLRVDLLGQRQLHEDAVDLLVRIETVHQRQQLRLRRLLGEAYGLMVKPRLLAGFALHAHVGGGGGVVSDQNARPAWMANTFSTPANSPASCSSWVSRFT